MENDEDSLGQEPQTDHDDYISDPGTPNTEQDVDIIDNAHVGPKQADTVSADGDENESAEVTDDFAAEADGDTEEEMQVPLAPELQEGLKILEFFLAESKLTEPFRDDVFSQLSETEVQKYRREIKEPMWLLRMKEKFQRGEYDSITQVVNDFQLMIYNCQRFNGISHPISKKAAKIDVILRQKLNLLRSDIRCKIAQDNSSPWQAKQDSHDISYGTGLRKRTANHRLEDSSAMLIQLRMEEEQKAKEERRLKKEESRAAQLAAHRELIDWEEENITVEPIKSVIRHSWEIPQIGLFLYLCHDVLNLEEVPLYELERCLAMARQSKRLQQIMTALLSTPFQREKRSEKSLPDMPYSVWTEKLARVVDVWYKTLQGCCGDQRKAACMLGLEEQSFEVLGPSNPLREKLFHNLSFYKKIWILKSLCDYLVDIQEYLRAAIEDQDQPDQRALVLGSDRYGNLYVHFTQFCGPDLRIYRQRKPGVPVVGEENGNVEEEEETLNKSSKVKSSAKRKLNLDSPGGKRSRSVTPLNIYDTDGTASPAPSETRTKSCASSSRQSSPVPNGRSRQTSARNSPAPDSSSLDGFAVNVTSSKGRKTRNSAESTFYDTVDLEALFRRNSRRSRAVKRAAKEALDMESNSAVGDDNSQDGLLDAAAVSALEDSVTTESQYLNGKISREKRLALTGCETESGVTDTSSACTKSEADSSAHSFSHPDISNSSTEMSKPAHIKSDPGGSTYNPNTTKQQDSMEPRESCDVKGGVCVKEEPDSSIPVSANTTLSGNMPSTASSSLTTPTSCDSHHQSATDGNPSNTQQSTQLKPPSPNPAAAGSQDCTAPIKEENVADDSGFTSFHVSPHHASSSTDPKTDSSIHTHKVFTCSSVENSNNVSESQQQESTMKMKAEETAKLKDDGHGRAVKSEEQDIKEEKTDSLCRVKTEKTNATNCIYNNGVQANANALVDHAAYSEEEMVPDPGEFEMIVDDLDGLENLIKKFDPDQVESSPQVSPGARSGKRQKSKAPTKPVKRWNCENDLHQRLVLMHKELQQYRSKLASLTKKARLKLQREFQNYVQETVKVEDVKAWESEPESEGNTEESGVDDSVSGEEAGEDSQDGPVEIQAVASKKNAPSLAPSTGSVESSDTDQRCIEDYEADVSSRGRLRKRRLIPNNVEDQGVKKKKVVKKTEEVTPATTASQVPNILQRSEDGGIMVNLTNSEFLALMEQGGSAASELVQQLAAAKNPSTPGLAVGWKPQGIQIIGGPTLHSYGKPPGMVRPGVTQAGSYSVLQKILSTQSSSDTHQTVNLSRQKVQANTVTSSASLLGQSSSVTVTVVSTTPTVTMSRPSEAAGSGAVNMRSPLLMTASIGGGKQKVFMLTAKQQKDLIRGGVLRCQDASQAAQSSRAAVKPVSLTVSTSAGSATPPVTLIPSVSKPGKLTILQAAPLQNPSSNRYAGNVTVKTLLENRAANKTDISDSSKTSETSPVRTVLTLPQAIVVSSSCVPVNSPVTVVTANTVGGAPATSIVQCLLPAVRPAGQSSLDDALQTVVTSYHTTLPTADIKVPSPTTLPSLSPRKNVTRIVQSNKAPIPTTTKVETKHSPVVLASAIVPGVSALGPRAMTAIVPQSNLVRPGTVILPSGQGADASGKKHLVVQVVPRGATAGSGSVMQGYVVPQGAIRTLQLANVKPPQPGVPPSPSSSSQDVPALQLLKGQTQLGSQALSSGAMASSATASAQQPSCQADQGLLMTAPTSQWSATTSAQNVLQSATTSAVTSAVLKSMLAAKAVALTPSTSSVTHLPSPATPQVSAPAITMTSTTTPAGVGLVTNNQHSTAPRIIRAQVAGVRGAASGVQLRAVGGQGGAGLAMIPQGSPAGRILTTSAPVNIQLQNMVSVTSSGAVAATQSQQIPMQNVVHVSLPAGLQLAGLQPGASTVRLLAAGQPASAASNTMQPVLATIKPGSQGLQQLQLLAPAGALQRLRLAQPPQHVTVKTNVAAGQVVSGQTVSAEQQQTVQLRFKVQPGGQAVVGAAAASTMPQTILQGTGMRLAQPSVLAPPPVSPHSLATASRVIMASHTAPAPTPEPQQSPTTRAVCVSGIGSTAVNSAGNRLSMSVTPGPLNKQFTIAPVPAQSPNGAVRAILQQMHAGQPDVSPPQVSSAGSREGQVTHVVPQTATSLPGGIKRSLSGGSVHLIPPKKALLDTSSGNSGAVLASLSQMVGSMKGGSSQAGGDAAGTSPARAAPGNGVQRIIMASGAGDNSASTTLLNLAAHVSPATMAASATSTVDTGPVASCAQTMNMAQFLQQIAGVAPLSVQVKTQQVLQQQQQQQQQLVGVRRIGGQLLTESNIPVTESNGEYKVLPKATLQLGSQTVTVLSPSSAMIQNIRSPVANTVRGHPSGTAITAGSTLSHLQAGAVPLAGQENVELGTEGDLVSSETQVMMTKPAVVLSAHPSHSQSAVRAGSHPLSAGQDTAAGSDPVHLPVAEESGLLDLKREVPITNCMPVLKARLEQPVVSHPVRVPGVLISGEGSSHIANGQQQLIKDTSTFANGDMGSLDLPGSKASAAQMDAKCDSQNEVEEEAALNLLTLANQPVMGIVQSAGGVIDKASSQQGFET